MVESRLKTCRRLQITIGLLAVSAAHVPVISGQQTPAPVIDVSQRAEGDTERSVLRERAQRPRPDRVGTLDRWRDWGRAGSAIPVESWQPTAERRLPSGFAAKIQRVKKARPPRKSASHPWPAAVEKVVLQPSLIEPIPNARRVGEAPIRVVSADDARADLGPLKISVSESMPLPQSGQSPKQAAAAERSPRSLPGGAAVIGGPRFLRARPISRAAPAQPAALVVPHDDQRTADVDPPSADRPKLLSSRATLDARGPKLSDFIIVAPPPSSRRSTQQLAGRTKKSAEATRSVSSSRTRNSVIRTVSRKHLSRQFSLDVSKAGERTEDAAPAGPAEPADIDLIPVVDPTRGTTPSMGVLESAWKDEPATREPAEDTNRRSGTRGKEARFDRESQQQLPPVVTPAMRARQSLPKGLVSVESRPQDTPTAEPPGAAADIAAHDELTRWRREGKPAVSKRRRPVVEPAPQLMLTQGTRSVLRREELPEPSLLISPVAEEAEDRRAADDFKPISEISADISTAGEERPADLAERRFALAESIDHPLGVSRDGIQAMILWEAPATSHRPLYFEEVNLERHGYSAGLFQPVLSAAHFFGRVPALPYLMAAEKGQVCHYTLGHYRPGSCAPYQLYLPPLSVKGLSVQATSILGMLYLIP